MRYKNFKKIIFTTNPETAHSLAVLGITIMQKSNFLSNYFKSIYTYENKKLEQELFKTIFKNPVGLAAGFDKDADIIDGIENLGFGFTEIGTITNTSQEGNKKPRLFRLVKDESIQNAMGFNNKGGAYAKNNIQNSKAEYPLGVNIGKNKTTSEENAINDYIKLFELYKDVGTYIVINISSPNTPGLRNLQNENFIKEVFELGLSITKKPILLKISPDMNSKDAIKLCAAAIAAGASGIIATNTTTDYSLTTENVNFGGLSGKILKEKSYKLFKAIGEEFYGKTVLISVGGIDSAEEAYKRIKAGASLIQIYSMLVYKGPALVKEINEELVQLLEEDGYKNIKEAIGANYK